MQVVLLERVEKLGQIGDVVAVKPGYARNYLIPHGVALRASKRNLEEFENRRAQLEANNLKRREEAQAAASEIDGASVVIIRQASEGGQLYGSVSARDVVEAFAAEGVVLERKQVRLETPIKTLGIHAIEVALHPDVVITVTANVARSQDHADVQAGRATPEDFEQDDETVDDGGFQSTAFIDEVE